MKKVFKILFNIAILLTVSFAAYSSAPLLRQVLLSTGAVQEKILIAGTGSMYPTFPKGEGQTDFVRAQEIVAWPKMRKFPGGINLLGNKFFSYNLQHGDIVDFENAKTDELSKQKYSEEAGFVKRVIGLPGDTLNLRDGFVTLNGNNIDEPYTAKSRSTYGGDSLSDCQNLTISIGKVFVMGDNRKASLDSRFELGLVDLSDIRYVLPWDKQDEYRRSYRDTKEDRTLANTTTLDSEEFVRLLNQKRKDKNLKPYKLDPLLSLSSKRRGSIMISTNDFSDEATKSAVTMVKAVKEVGYRNILYAEIQTRGFYEASELLDNFLEFPQTQKILLGSDYQDIGLAPVIGEINGCPVQVVVVHLGGYVAPNYKKEDIEGWQNLLDNLSQVIESWSALKSYPNIDQSKLTQLLNLLNSRKDIATKVTSRMKTNQWFTDAEQNLVSSDKQLAEEANNIIAELNKK